MKADRNRTNVQLIEGGRPPVFAIEIDHKGTHAKIPAISNTKLRRVVNWPESHPVRSRCLLHDSWSLFDVWYAVECLLKLSAAIRCNILDDVRPSMLAIARLAKRIIVDAIKYIDLFSSEDLHFKTRNGKMGFIKVVLLSAPTIDLNLRVKI